MGPAAELPESVNLTANTETNSKKGLLSEDASQDDRSSIKTPRISAIEERVSSSSSMRSFGSNSPTPRFTTNTRLRSEHWTEAYDCLKEEEPRLVDAYERILSLHLDEHTGVTADIGSQENDIEKMEPEERQEVLKDIIKAALTTSESGASTEKFLDNSKDNLEFVKQIISSITEAAEEVAFAWMGVCLALKFLLEPVTPQGFNRETAAFLISRMKLYWYMSVLVMDEDGTGGPAKGSRDYITQFVIEVYTRALSWQMKSICAYYKEQENLFLQDLPSAEYKEVRHDLLGKERHILALADNSTAWRIVSHLNDIAYTATSNEVKLGHMHLEDVPTICTACGNLDPRIWREDYYSAHLIHVRHASSECSACMVIIRGLSAIVKPLDERAQLTLSVRKEASLRVCYHWGVLSAKGSRNLEFYIQQGYPSPWPAVRPGRSLQSTMRPRSMELVSEWFHRCLKKDQMCRAQSSTLPTRVLYVGNESREPYLYETLTEEATYTALSHCWGGIQGIHLTTTTANLKDRMDSIPMSTLPQTFADAVLLTRELGIKYIWIDSLCIIQDDTKDWERESSRMAEVYQNATLTISADGAADGSKGLFQPTEIPLFEEIPIPFQSPTGSGVIYARETTLETYGDHVHVIGHKEKDPLQRRGWVLQEWLLSNRIVHFTTGELLWECKALQFCQCQVISQSSTEWDAQSSRSISKGDYYEKGPWGGRYIGGGHLEWTQVVRGFTERQLTIQTDRLPALSGLASFTKSNAAEDYVAGLWKSELPDAMLWQVDSDESERHEDYYAPSWSWASIHGVISFHKLSGFDEFPLECKVLELVTVLATDNPFGPLKSGFIKIQGPVGILSGNMKRMGKLLELKDEREETKYWGELVLDVKGHAFEVTSADEIPFLIVRRETMDADVIYGIALKRKADEGPFMRVGYVWIAYHGRNWESWILNNLKVKKQIVTIE